MKEKKAREKRMGNKETRKEDNTWEWWQRWQKWLISYMARK
jgi:hypothetical protein